MSWSLWSSLQLLAWQQKYNIDLLCYSPVFCWPIHPPLFQSKLQLCDLRVTFWNNWPVVFLVIRHIMYAKQSLNILTVSYTEFCMCWLVDCASRSQFNSSATDYLQEGWVVSPLLLNLLMHHRFAKWYWRAGVMVSSAWNRNIVSTEP